MSRGCEEGDKKSQPAPVGTKTPRLAQAGLAGVLQAGGLVFWRSRGGGGSRQGTAVSPEIPLPHTDGEGARWFWGWDTFPGRRRCGAICGFGRCDRRPGWALSWEEGGPGASPPEPGDPREDPPGLGLALPGPREICKRRRRCLVVVGDIPKRL